MQIVVCPRCASALSVADDMGGRTAQCPNCQTPFLVPFVMAAPLPPGASPGPPLPVPPKQPSGQEIARTAVIWGVAGLAAGIAAGAIASQWFPVFGGLLTQIAEPMSPVRLQALPGHCLAGGILGVIVGAGVSALLRYAAFPFPRSARLRASRLAPSRRTLQSVLWCVAGIAGMGALLALIALIGESSQRRLDRQNATAAAPGLLKTHAEDLPESFRSSGRPFTLVRVELRPHAYQVPEVAEARHPFTNERVRTTVYVDRVGTAAVVVFETGGREVEMRLIRGQGEKKWKFAGFEIPDAID